MTGRPYHPAEPLDVPMGQAGYDQAARRDDPDRPVRVGGATRDALELPRDVGTTPLAPPFAVVADELDDAWVVNCPYCHRRHRVGKVGLPSRQGASCQRGGATFCVVLPEQLPPAPDGQAG